MLKKLWDIFFLWGVPHVRREEMEDVDVVVSHEFGDQKTLSRTTAIIAQGAARIARLYDLPWIAQHPGGLGGGDTKPFAEITHHKLVAGAYLDTEEVNRQIADICRQNRWTKAVVMTHPHHAWRAGENLKHNGILAVFTHDIYEPPYDKNNSRRALSTPWLFIPREILARLVYLFKFYLSY